MLHPGYCPIVIPYLLVLFRSRADRCACAEPKADKILLSPAESMS
jgi:hypothetical protein